MRPSSYRNWQAAVPEDFVFSIKGGRYITHMKRLRDVKQALANFFASGLLCLGEQLGPVLWQLPPTMRFDRDVLEAFFELLPRSLREVEQLARQHDRRLDGRVALEARVSDRPVWHTLEVRHDSFAEQSYVDLLRSYRIASCVADSAGLYPMIEDVTADFTYARLHGATRLYVSGYSAKALQPWVTRIQTWLAGGRPAFVYFDNDVKVRAPFDAQNLTRLLAGMPAKRLPKSLDSVTEEPRTSWQAWRS
jgi:uncharacterized protein YecE (DUF72 family)